jgi:hypothetical protein
MRFEQGDKTLGEGAGADNADSQAHVGIVNTPFLGAV